jgi:hypothetical protein
MTTERAPEPVVAQATDMLTLVEAYDAMRIFLQAVCRQHGCAGEQIELVLAGQKWEDGSPVDPTMWGEWLAAVQDVHRRRVP